MFRREFLAVSGSAVAAAATEIWNEALRKRIAAYLEQHRRPEGGYGWASDVTAQVTPTFGAVGAYRALGLRVPDSAAVAAFVRDHYPVPETRRTERPLWRLDFEQVQTLRWLDQPIDGFRALAATWTKPADFTTRYELGGNPVFQHQAMAVRVRHMLGLSPGEADQPWRDYLLARRRANGTFNNTPAPDRSGGHLLNTLWGVLAADGVGLTLSPAPELAAWVRACQTSSGGFTYAPDAKTGAVDDLVYTWSALQLLQRERTAPEKPRQCAEWIESLFTPEGGFQDRAGGEPNPLATYYALESLAALGQRFREPSTAAPRARHAALPPGASVFSIQIEAPGNGSPREALLMAKTLGIHLWAAKNSSPGWIEEARKLAAEAKAPVQFAIGDEEYGTYFAVPGLGCYSHLVDMVAPYGADVGVRLPRTNHPYSWQEFEQNRAASLRRGGGRLIWQFNENEELTRILLDDAGKTGTYSAIASFHFGNENFLHSQPFLQRWYGRIPFVGLQDAHGKESWWWGNQLSGFTTLFIAREPTWEAWLAALDRGHVMAVRHDAVTRWKTHLAGGSAAVRDFVLKRQQDWRWWNDAGEQARRPAAALTLLEPGMKFEVGAPQSGAALRIRLWCENTGQGLPREPRAELVELRVDGQLIRPQLHESKDDRYYLAQFDSGKPRRAQAIVRLLSSNQNVQIEQSWEE